MLSPDLATGYDYTYDADVGKYLDLHAYSGTYVTFDDADSLSEKHGISDGRLDEQCDSGRSHLR